MVRVDGTATPPSLTSTGQVPAIAFLAIVAVNEVALTKVVVCSTLLTQIRQPGTKLVPVQVSSVVPVPDTDEPTVSEANAGLDPYAGDSVEACEPFGPSAIVAAVRSGPVRTDLLVSNVPPPG